MTAPLHSPEASRHEPETGREYVREVLDRSTGELQTISLGRWMTVTELGQLHGVGPRRVRTILREMGFIYAPGGGPKQAHRICPWAVEAGLGRRHEHGKNIKHAFDVVSPSGQAWIAERWSSVLKAVEARERTGPVEGAIALLLDFKTSRGRTLTVVQEVYWLVDHLPGLNQQQMAEALGVTQQLVSRYLRERGDQIAKWRRWRSSSLPCRASGAEVSRLRARKADD